MYYLSAYFFQPLPILATQTLFFFLKYSHSMYPLVISFGYLSIKSDSPSPPHLLPYNVFFLSTRLIYTDIHMTNYNYSRYTGIQTLSGFYK